MSLPEGFAPMLAGTLERLEGAVLPAFVSVKVDGFRCLIVDGQPVSRELKPIVNDFVRNAMNGLPHGLDGELVTLTDGKLDDFNTIQSKLNSRDGEPDWRYYVFDALAETLCLPQEAPFWTLPFRARNDSISWLEVARDEICAGVALDRVVSIPQRYIKTLLDLQDAERDAVDTHGWEGICLRSPDGPYKFGRSTVKEGYLLKYKRWYDAEAEIIGFKEQMANRNPATKSAIGKTERSSCKAGKVPKGTLGALVVRWTPPGWDKSVQFRLKSGLTDGQCVEMWADRDILMGRKVTFSYLKVGPNGGPRHPKFRGMRFDAG